MNPDTQPRRGATAPGSPVSKARILLVDDHAILREGLAVVINCEADLAVCGFAATAQEALLQVEKLKPDLAIVDVSLEGSHGIELVKDLAARFSKLPVLILSMHDEALYAERAVRAGAKGYLMKREPSPRLLQAIRKVLHGEIYLSERITSNWLRRVSTGGSSQPPLPIERLTDRELEVLELIGQGCKTRQIATALHLSIKTVQAHREHIKEKLGIPDFTSLTRFAVQWVESDQRI